jgi:hypothetical protein
MPLHHRVSRQSSSDRHGGRVTTTDPGVGVGTGTAATFVADGRVLASCVVSSRPLPIANPIRTIVATYERKALRLVPTIFSVTFFPGASLLGGFARKVSLGIRLHENEGPKGRQLIATPVRAWTSTRVIELSAEGATVTNVVLKSLRLNNCRTSGAPFLMDHRAHALTGVAIN